MKAKKKPTIMSETWKGEPFIDRLQSCLSMLVLHGVITDSENQKARKRIERIREETNNDS